MFSGILKGSRSFLRPTPSGCVVLSAGSILGLAGNPNRMLDERLSGTIARQLFCRCLFPSCKAETLWHLIRTMIPTRAKERRLPVGRVACHFFVRRRFLRFESSLQIEMLLTLALAAILDFA